MFGYRGHLFSIYTLYFLLAVIIFSGVWGTVRFRMVMMGAREMGGVIGQLEYSTEAELCF